MRFLSTDLFGDKLIRCVRFLDETNRYIYNSGIFNIIKFIKSLYYAVFALLLFTRSSRGIAVSRRIGSYLTELIPV